MTRTLVGTTVAFFTAIAIVGAQAPAERQEAPGAAGQQPSQQKPAQPAQPAAKAGTTVTGCLKAGTAAGTWTLENAELASAAAPGAQPKPSAAGTAGTKETYTLVVKPDQDLKSHMNQKIEVTGTLSPSSAKPGAAPAPARQDLNVESFKMISATCP